MAPVHANFSILNKTRTRLPRTTFNAIKDAVLGKKYELSVALIPAAEMHRITLQTKKKDHVSNVLSFPLSKNSGEILLCPTAAAPYSLTYLFIHGCLHLKGHKHSATMDRIEQTLLKRFTFHAKNSHGHRRRHLSS